MEKLKRFNKSNKKRNTIKLALAFILVAVVSATISYAVYQRVDEVLFINAKVGHFETSSSDIELAMKLDGEDVDTPPSKGYYNVVVECDNADGSWDKEEWLAKIGNIRSNRVKCNVNFETYKLSIQDVKIGDYISMTPTSTSYTPPSELTGCMNDSNCTQNTINPSELSLWRVIKKNEDGTVDVVSEYVSSTEVSFYGRTGYINLVGGLNEIAGQYTNENYVSSTRHMGYSNQIEILTNTSKLSQSTAPWSKSTSGLNFYEWPGCDTKSYLCGKDEEFGAGDIKFVTDYNLIKTALGNMSALKPDGSLGAYWVNSRRFYNPGDGNFAFLGVYVQVDGRMHHSVLFSRSPSVWYIEKTSLNIRPILTIKSNVEIISGDGKSRDTAYQLD